MDFKKYSVEDFVLNQGFRKWILQPTKEDNLHWEEWLRVHPEQLDTIIEAKKVLLSLPKEEQVLGEAEKKALWQDVWNDIQKETPGSTPKVFPIHSASVLGRASQAREERSFGFYVRRAVIAASVLVFLGFSVGLYQSVFDSDEKPASAAVETIHKQNPWGQKSTVFLSDGSEVTLNSGSALSYPKDFSDQERVVRLEGEAFFKVAKDAQRPFRVISKNVTTTALGTSFNVKAFESESHVSVALVTGKVLVAHNTPLDGHEGHFILKPGEQATIGSSPEDIAKTTFDMREMTAWKDGVIYFKNASAQRVFSYLEKWYGVEIREENRPRKKWNYTGEFNNMDLHNVLSSIGFTMNFEFRKEGKQVLIHYVNE